MTLSEALALLRREKEAIRRRKIFLACGFQPLHLLTFLKAHFTQRFPEQAADVQTGLYGDFMGTLASAAGSECEAAVVVIEWSDCDPRLGLRSSGGWGRSAQESILANCREFWPAVLARLKDVAGKMPVALVLPALPTPLFGHTTGWQTSAAQAELERQAGTFTADAAALDNVRIVNASRLAGLSPPSTRLDPKMELGAGFPYSIAHASALADSLIHLLYPASPMKGLISDLDDTLWSGIVGEVGVAAVNWSLAEHAQIHGLYQQQLRHLSEMGVLLAVASKNETAVVDEALRREDLYIPRDCFFPVCAAWKPKSQSVAEILKAWNVGPDSVVFVDDSPMELDEVRSAYPAMTCLQFPTGKPAQILALLEGLRDLFGKPEVQKDDALRQSSIRSNAAFQQAAAQTDHGEFVRGLQGKVTFDTRKDGSNKRLLELINKTNQFNLNGVRLSEGEWLQHLAHPDSVVVSVSYEDKFGPLGVIGVVAGRQSGNRLDVSSWVMSCRAFSRRIEYHTLDFLLRSTGCSTVALGFQATERNQPLQEFLQEMGVAADCVLSSKAFLDGKYDLPHEVVAAGSLATAGTVER